MSKRDPGLTGIRTFPVRSEGLKCDLCGEELRTGTTVVEIEFVEDDVDSGLITHPACFKESHTPERKRFGGYRYLKPAITIDGGSKPNRISYFQ